METKKITIPINIPAYFIEAKNDEEDPRFTKCKLKVFYKGLTADKRKFTSEFSEKLIKTIYSIPVVAFYDNEKDDFVGHNGTQYSYGHVPENAEVEFKTDANGVEWAISDILLYTGRPDNIGDIASKIVGKYQSLEMDPDTIKYKINRDVNGKFKDLEFTEGSLIGLSVLGDDQQPAFTGSQFFTALDENNIEVIKNFEDNLQNLRKEKEMTIEINDFEAAPYYVSLSKYLQATVQDNEAAIYNWCDANGVWGCIVELPTDMSYVVLNQYTADGWRFFKYDLSFAEDGKAELSNPVSGKMRFAEDGNDTFETKGDDDGQQDEGKDGNVSGGDESDESGDNSDCDKEENAKKCGEDDENKCVTTPIADDANTVDSEAAFKEQLESYEQELNKCKEEIQNYLAIIASYEKEKKVALVNSFADRFEQNILDSFKTDDMLSLSIEDLKNKILVKYAEIKLEQETNTNNHKTNFSSIVELNDFDSNNLEEVMKQHGYNINK